MIVFNVSTYFTLQKCYICVVCAKLGLPKKKKQSGPRRNREGNNNNNNQGNNNNNNNNNNQGNNNNNNNQEEEEEDNNNNGEDGDNNNNQQDNNNNQEEDDATAGPTSLEDPNFSYTKKGSYIGCNTTNFRGAQQPWLTDRGREPRFGLDRPTGALFKISQTAVWRRG